MIFIDQLFVLTIFENQSDFKFTLHSPIYFRLKRKTNRFFHESPLQKRIPRAVVRRGDASCCQRDCSRYWVSWDCPLQNFWIDQNWTISLQSANRWCFFGGSQPHMVSAPPYSSCLDFLTGTEWFSMLHFSFSRVKAHFIEDLSLWERICCSCPFLRTGKAVVKRCPWLLSGGK